MLLQTNSYIVPQDKRAEHARLLRRFRQVLARIGCDQFEVYEQVGSNWNTAEITGRVVQIMRFRDRRHQLAVQAAERNDPAAQAVIAEFCNLINFPYQQQQGLFAVGFYNAVIPVSPARGHAEQDAHEAQEAKEAAAALAASRAEPASSLDASPAADDESDLDGSAGALAREATLSGDEAPAPALHAEEPVFAEGTEGIIAAAEQLSDEQLDAGGDAAMADAIATVSSNGSPASAAETPAPSEPGPLQSELATTEPPEVDLPRVELGHDDLSPSAQGESSEMDLSALLDPHLGADNGPGNGHAESNGNGGGPADWASDLSLDGVLDEERDPAHRESLNDTALGQALESESEHGPNHVSR